MGLEVRISQRINDKAFDQTGISDSVKMHRKEHRQPNCQLKVIETVSGNIQAVSGPAAQDRPGTYE